ncbi:MAG: enoyl-CoA hydratase/isomerase family protein, partial [Gemmatimonadota bacterium]|nr:enoyl-CoA hydratase/isomerase family protein [Gemmatimonadota bacterium]
MKGKRMENLVLEESRGVLHVTLDRPERRNAINLGMFDELRSAFEEAKRDPRIRVVVLRGAEGNFCSGGDLAPDDAPGDESPIEERTRRILEERVTPMANALHALPQPTIAAVEGIAAGAGANLAFGCDFVVAVSIRTLATQTLATLRPTAWGTGEPSSSMVSTTERSEAHLQVSTGDHVPWCEGGNGQDENGP